MDRETAKAILSRHRPGHTDSLDKNLAEAMELAHRDPELRAWYLKHSAKYSQTSAPAPAEAPPVKPDAAAGRHASWGSMARWMMVVTVLVVGTTMLWSSFAPQQQNTFANYRDRMARIVQRSYPMKTAVTNLDEIRRYLRLNGGASGFDLPHRLDTFQGHGAAVFTWHNQPVSLVGLVTPETNNLYLFITSRSTFVDPPDLSQTNPVQVGKFTTAVWTVGGNVYLLAADDSVPIRNYAP